MQHLFNKYYKKKACKHYLILLIIVSTELSTGKIGASKLIHRIKKRYLPLLTYPAFNLLKSVPLLQ